MSPILMYWFDAQQQTCTLRPQNCGCFYLKFSAQSNGLGLPSNQKMAKTKVGRETAKWCRSEPKG